MTEQRRQFYNDQKLQGYLLVGLIILEFALVLLMLLYFFMELNNIIDAHLYRLHDTQTASWPEILSLLALTMAGFLIVNIAALYVAHLIWGRYVRQTINLFSAGLDKIIARDFSDNPPTHSSHHHIIALLETWFSKEQRRNRQIRVQVERLDSYAGKPITASDQLEIQKILQDYQRLLTP